MEFLSCLFLICCLLTGCAANGTPESTAAPVDIVTPAATPTAETHAGRDEGAIRKAAEEAVRALPEADTVTDFDNPELEIVDGSLLSFSIANSDIEAPQSVYAVSYPTTADAILGPITVYLDYDLNVLGFALRD